MIRLSLNPNAPDYRRGFLRVPLPVWLDVYCKAPLTRRQLQIVSVVIRETWGWQERGGQVREWTRPLTTADFAEATGLSTDYLARDLRELIGRRVLLERDLRYQFVPDPRRWITRPQPEPKPRPGAHEGSESGAETAPAAPSVKTGKTVKDSAPLQQQFPTVVDNSARSGDAPLSPPGERFGEVVAAFVGALTPEQSERLRRWICRDGIAGVWREVEPVLRRDPLAARSFLERRLAQEETRGDA